MPIITDLERLIVFFDVFLDRIRQTISDRRLKFLGQQVAADKTRSTTVTIIEWVDISEQVMENSHLEQFIHFVCVQYLKSLFHTLDNLALRVYPAMDFFLGSRFYAHRILTKDLSVR